MSRCIVVATDFSDQAGEAISHAVVIARSRSAELVLVHATSMPDSGYNTYRVPSAYRQLADELSADSRVKLNKEKERLEALGLQVSIRCEIDVPKLGILKVATDCGAGLIVVGSHGRKGLARFLIGSVAEHVARHAECDVLIARGPAPEHGYTKLLVPTDFSEVGEEVLKQTVHLVEGQGTIDLLHYWQLPGASINYWGSTDHGLGESIRKGAEELGEKWVKRYTTERVAISFSSERGDPRRCIVDRAKNLSYDLIVMASHRRKGLQRVLLGSVAETALRYLTSSVYITRPST